MYTRCPHCTTIVRITAEELRAAHGDVQCGTCQQPFNAVISLSDDVTTLMVMPNTPGDSVPDDAVQFDSESGDSEPDESGPDEYEPDNSEPDESEPDDLEPDESESGDLEPDEFEQDYSALDESDLSDTEPTATVAEFSVDDMEPEAPDEPGDEIFAAKAAPTPEPEEEEPPTTDNQQPIESMEFDAPEQTWTKFFVTSGDKTSSDSFDQDVAGTETEGDDDEPWISDTDNESIEFQTDNSDEWHGFLEDLDEVESSSAAKSANNENLGKEELWDYEPEDSEPENEQESSIIPLWLTDDSLDESSAQQRESRLSWPMSGACVAMVFLLAGQLLHYNRDALAAHETYGAAVRQVYHFLGAPLYPDWPLDAFKITGTEAIAGRSNQNALDILANVIVGGRQPIGLPLIRVVLRDRWSNPVATRVFDADEYLREFNPENLLVGPGTALPVEISVADPGAEALGYVIDVCLPRRKTGLECQIARDPFQ